MHDLAVIILNYSTTDHTRDLLLGCLASLRNQSDLDFITCVVDNCSPDNSADLVAQQFPDVLLVRSTTNDGYAAGNNLGLRALGFPDQGQARYAMLLNPDTVVPAGALASMIAYADAHSDAGVVGPKLMLMDGTLDAACRRSFPTPEVSFYRLLGLSKLFPHSRRFGRYNMTYLGIDEETEVDSVVGACMLVRADALRKAGLLDEQFFMYGEDLDWCLRIKQQRNEQGAPYRVLYYPGATVQHVKRAASRRSPKAQYEFDRAMWLFYRKHYQPSTPLPMDWLVKLGLAARGGSRLAREIWKGAN
jgi:N-acetylglucosaminyl-diphospho-decaprenol L-rhamnosyltransferase